MKEYIEREAAINAVYDQCVDSKMYGNDETEGTLVEAYEIANRISDLPAADVRPVVRGEWIKNDGKVGWHCSICKEVNNYAFSWNNDTGKDDFQDNFCPHCGAEMKEKK